jgi:hypothetical protein
MGRAVDTPAKAEGCAFRPSLFPARTRGGFATNSRKKSEHNSFRYSLTRHMFLGTMNGKVEFTLGCVLSVAASPYRMKTGDILIGC